LGLYETTGLGADFDGEYEKQINQITADDLQAAAQKYFKNYLLIRQEP
jgi:predicted Zn-dependent peptidase